MDRSRRWLIGAVAAVGGCIVTAWIWLLPYTLPLGSQRSFLATLGETAREIRAGVSQSSADVAQTAGPDLTRAFIEEAQRRGVPMTADQAGAFILTIPPGWHLVDQASSTVQLRTGGTTLRLTYPATVTPALVGAATATTTLGRWPATISTNASATQVILLTETGYALVTADRPDALNPIEQLVSSVHFRR